MIFQNKDKNRSNPQISNLRNNLFFLRGFFHQKSYNTFKPIFIINTTTKFIKSAIYLLLILLFPFNLLAQKLKVQVNTTTPSVGVPFEISFSTDASLKDFVPPSFKDFEIISGPNHSQSIQFINGSLSQSSSISYVLIPKKEGNIVIGPAKAIVNNNQTIYSESITLQVQKNSANNHYSTHSNNPSNSNRNVPEANVSDKDIFVRTFVNKKQCYIGEQITLTQKIYTRVELRGIQNVKFPHLDGFWSKNQENNSNIQLHVENIDGYNYYVGEISHQYLFPQKSGKITIPPIEIECVIRKRVNRAPRDIFEQFFGVNAYEDQVVTLKSQPVSVYIQDLPTTNKSGHFSGAVGSHFSFKVEINRNKVPANESVNLKMSISGQGNVPLVDAPHINFPPEFETYDPKITENISTTSGVSGSKTFEYLIIPRKEGTYKLSDISFSYFDITKKAYVTIPGPELTIEVTPPIGNTSAAQVYQQYKQEVKDENLDIRYIKPLPYSVYQKHPSFFNSPLHISLMLFPYLAMIVLFGYRKYQQRQTADWASFQQKRAQKIALKHLAFADKMLKENKGSEFYTAIIQALENYLTYKFKLHKADLSKEKIKQIFEQHRIPDDLQTQFFDIINTCEMAKYAPGATQHALSEIYSTTKNLIIQLENQIKKELITS